MTAVDIASDAALAMLAAGALHDPENHVQSPSSLYQNIGQLVAERRRRLIFEAMKEAARATSGPSLMLAALFEGADPEEILSEAVQRFRAVAWTDLRQRPDIILEGDTLDIIGEGAADLYSLSATCALGECDFFWSHSWRDDRELKWKIISDFCEEFQRSEGRLARLWLDKVCIDQVQIARDLQCLPVFLAGCNQLLITSGTTYTSRLWCVVELFVHFSVRMEDTARHAPRILFVAENDQERAAIMRSWLRFSSLSCQCFNPADKIRILNVIDSFPGGAYAFNVFIHQLAAEIFGEINTDADDGFAQLKEVSVGQAPDSVGDCCLICNL